MDDGDISVLSEFTGTSESVLQVKSNREDLKSLLCRLVVISSTMQSHSISAASQDGDEEEAKKRAKDAIKQTVEPQKVDPIPGSDPNPGPEPDPGVDPNPGKDPWGGAW